MRLPLWIRVGFDVKTSENGTKFTLTIRTWFVALLRMFAPVVWIWRRLR